MSRPVAAVPDYLRESRAVLAALPEDVRDDLTWPLHKARAALWLQDQIRNGELSFLGHAGEAPPCWASAEACESMTATTLRDWLEDLAVKGLATALAELVVLIAPADEATVAPVA